MGYVGRAALWGGLRVGGIGGVRSGGLDGDGVAKRNGGREDLWCFCFRVTGMLSEEDLDLELENVHTSE